MKIFKENKILFVVLLAYVHGIMSMQTPEKPPRRPLTQDEHKLLSDQRRNVKCAGEVGAVLKRARDEGYDALKEQDIEKLSRDFNFMKNTPLKTKKDIADKVIAEAFDDLDLENDGSVIKNNQMLNTLRSSSAKKTKIISTVAAIVPSPERKKKSALDIDHVMNPQLFYNPDQSLRAISGGHAYERYQNNNLLNGIANVFIGSDNKTIGIAFGQDISKTVRVGLTEDSVIQDFKNSVTMAKSPDNKRFRISKTDDNSYFGSYEDIDNPLIFPTQFPVLVISNQQVDEDGKIYIGQFAQPAQDGSLVDKDGKIYVAQSAQDGSLNKDKSLYISVDDFNQIMSESKHFESQVKDFIFADITNKLNIKFEANLAEEGIDQFPAAIYGMLDNR